MEERHIRAKNEKGLIAHAGVQRSANGWVAVFVEEGGKIRHRLTRQRGEERVFKTLDAAQSTLRRMGFKAFLVISDK